MNNPWSVHRFQQCVETNVLSEPSAQWQDVSSDREPWRRDPVRIADGLGSRARHPVASLSVDVAGLIIGAVIGAVRALDAMTNGLHAVGMGIDTLLHGRIAPNRHGPDATRVTVSRHQGISPLLRSDELLRENLGPTVLDDVTDDV